MDVFTEKIKVRKQADQDRLQDSFGTLLRNMDPGSQPRKQESAATTLLTEELGRIFASFDLTMPDLPTEGEPEDILSAAMLSGGLMRRKIVLRENWWKDGAAPLLCTGEDGRFYALLPSGGGYRCWNGNRYVRVTKKNAGAFAREAYCFYRCLDNRSISLREFSLFLLRGFRRTDVICLLLISLTSALLGMIMPLIYQFVFHMVIPSGTSKEVTGLSVLISGTVIITGLLAMSRAVWVTRIGDKLELLAQNAVWARVLSLPASFFQNYESGDLARRVSAIRDICQILGGQLIPTVLGSLFSLLYLFQIQTMVPALFLPAMVVVALLFLVYLASAMAEIHLTEQNDPVNNALTSMVYQLLEGITKIRLAGAESRAFSRWAKKYSELRIMPGKFLLISNALSSAILFGGTICLYAIAGRLHLSASDYIAFNSAFALLYTAVMSLAGVSAQAASLRPAIRLLRPILEQAPENTGVKKRVTKLSGEILVDNVKFRYREDMPYVLDELYLHVQPGEYLGIVGSSGCGKSTLFRVLLGFETPEFGTVSFDGQDAEGLDLRSVRQRIGTVLQNGKLFSGDIYSNIVIGAPWLTVEDAWQAAELSGFADDIRAMPMGMYTIISEGGGGLSGGQQQRLLITRALAAKPDILLFDEATSALDNLTQAHVVETLASLTCTRIVIAHRLSTIRGCSRIVYLDKGKVAEEGTFEELMALNGKFAALAARQIL